MPTPMHVYDEIAARFGVDGTDPEAVTRFFTDDLVTYPEQLQALIFDELLSRDAEADPTEQDWRQTFGLAMTRLHFRLQRYRIMLGRLNQ
ncbi:MAG: hypothetical protein ABL983_02095 [Nitrospira sp.]